MIVQLHLIGEVAMVETFQEEFHEGSRHFSATATANTLVIELIQVTVEVLREVYVLMVFYFVDDIEYYLFMETIHTVSMIAIGREKILKLLVVGGPLDHVTIEVVLKIVAAYLLEADGARSVLVERLQLSHIVFE